MSNESAESVEVVREVIVASRSGDLEAHIDAVVARCDPRVEFRSVLTAVEGATYLGHDGIRRYFSDLADSWQEWQNEPEEIVEVGPDTVLANVQFRGTGRSSGVAVVWHSALVFVLSDGKLLQIHSYASREAALEGLRLRG
jgi:ketosteroid isomerase-like protein